jgi:coenzyme Q-binding protein COQ10
VISHRETRSVPYPAALMYAVVADVEKYPEFLPWVLALRIVSRQPTGMTAEMVVGYSGLRERYTSEVTLDPAAWQIDAVQVPNGRIGGPFRRLENHWRFTPQDDHCEVEFSILFEFKNPLLHKVAGLAFEGVLLKMADAFEARAKAITEKEETAS